MTSSTAHPIPTHTYQLQRNWYINKEWKVTVDFVTLTKQLGQQFYSKVEKKTPIHSHAYKAIVLSYKIRILKYTVLRPML